MQNLLDIPVLGAFIQSTWTWRLLRLGMLALLLVMIAYGWPHHAVPGVNVRDPLMYSNLTTFGLWVAWMMGMVLVALIFGRSWCTVCPAGWLNGIVSRFGLRRELPQWLNNFIPVTLTLVLLQLLVYFFAIHRFPDISAQLLLGMLVLAMLVGLVFRRRAFCLLFCPAGAVFSLYARVAPWQLRVKDVATCEGCEAKPCISTRPFRRQAALGGKGLTWQARPEGCPVALVPAEIEDSSACTLCLNCVQTCCNDNVKLGFRSWMTDLLQKGLTGGESLFFLVLLGLLTANFSKVYVALREKVFWLPENLTLALGWDAPGFYFLAVLWIGLLFPALLLLPGLLVYLVGQVRVTSMNESTLLDSAADESPAVLFGGAGFVGFFGRLILPLLPMVLAAHLVLAVVKLNAKLGYLPLVMQDPTGVKSFLAISVMNTVSPPGVLLPLDMLKWVLAGLLSCGFIASSVIAWRSARRDTVVLGQPFFLASMINLLILTAFYGATVFEWLFVR